MSDCVSKFGRLNKRALMKSWSLLLLSDSKLLELLSLFPGLSSSTLLLPYLLQPTKFTNLAHLGAPPSTPLDMLLDSIRSIRSPLVPYCNRVYFRKKLTGLGSKSHCREPPPRSGEKPPDPCRLLRSSTTPPLWPCHPRGERQVGALGVLARWLRSLQMIPGLKY